MKPPKHLHILSICGYTTSGLALMARKMGYLVTGSDEDAYPPTTELLTREGILWNNFHDPKNLSLWGRPDFVVQANQVRADNGELLAAQKLKIPIIPDSRLFYDLTKDRLRIAVCGSHGKTTTSALVAWILDVAGRKPGFRLGTITKNFETSVRLGEGKEFVFEGDEYTTTAEDFKPKFYYFRPNTAIINNIEWDHPDVFETPAIYLNLFKDYLVQKMKGDGLLVVNGEDENVLLVTKGAPCKLVTFGLNAGDYQAQKIKPTQEGTSFRLFHHQEDLGSLFMPLFGEHNVRNALAAVSLSLEMRISLPNIRRALKTFKGASRRFEVVGRVRGVVVIDDYAHHPTKVRETIRAAKTKYPRSRLFVVFVPHTYSRTRALFENYLGSFTGADYLILADIEPARERRLEALVHSKDLVDEISKKQKNVFYIPDPKEVITFIKREARPGDVVLCMSVRGFDNLAQKLVENLKITLSRHPE